MSKLNILGVKVGFLPMKCPHCEFDRFKPHYAEYEGKWHFGCMSCHAFVEAPDRVLKLVNMPADELLWLGTEKRN